MKRWAILTVLLYAFALILLSLPVTLLALGNWGNDNSHLGFRDVAQFYSNWAYWLWLAILVTGQILLLLLPINIAEKRLPARRPLKTPIIVTAFFLANLCFAGIFSIVCAIFTDRAFDLFDLSNLFHSAANQNAQDNNSGFGTIFTMIFTLLIFWVMWALIFFRNFAKSDAPDALVKRTTRWLLRGSILELIVAVPSHVIVRRRDDCCAPLGTFWGIATGISVMLLCFGPGVYFLFAERCQRMQPKTPVASEPS